MNDQNPLVSIVTPSFNQGRFLEQTILSVLDQTYSRIEYLIVDGGSTDGSKEIIEKYQGRLAYWHSHPDDGFADALSQGFERSTGQIMAYLNSDDLLAPNAVEKAVEVLTGRSDIAMVYGNRVCIDETGQLLYLKPNLPILSRTPYIAMTIGQESCFWRRDIFVKVGGVNTSLKFAIDYDLFSRITLHGRVVHTGRVWGFFRRHGKSKTSTQYRTLGKQEGAAIQLAVWGKRVSRIKWLSVLLLMRLYALCFMFFVKKPQWPVCLPQIPQRGAYHRVRNGLRRNRSDSD